MTTLSCEGYCTLLKSKKEKNNKINNLNTLFQCIPLQASQSRLKCVCGSGGGGWVGEETTYKNARISAIKNEGVTPQLSNNQLGFK